MFYVYGLANAGPTMTEPIYADEAASLAASRAPSANNHIASTKSENGGGKPPAYPAIPSSDQIVGADSGMIKPPERPDD